MPYTPKEAQLLNLERKEAKTTKKDVLYAFLRYTAPVNSLHWSQDCHTKITWQQDWLSYAGLKRGNEIKKQTNKNTMQEREREQQQQKKDERKSHRVLRRIRTLRQRRQTWHVNLCLKQMQQRTETETTPHTTPWLIVSKWSLEHVTRVLEIQTIVCDENKFTEISAKKQ